MVVYFDGRITVVCRRGVDWHIWRFRPDQICQALKQFGQSAAAGGISWAQAAYLSRVLRDAASESGWKY